MVKTSLRTHSCGELTKKDVGKKVILSGWDSTRRDHGGLIFIDLRDRYGLTQVVFDPKQSKGAHAEAEKFRSEYIIQVQGKVRERPKGMENKKLNTGAIEVLVEKVALLSKAETPAIEVDDRAHANDEMRLKYRFLDLRRPLMVKNLELRNKAMLAAREYFDKHHFMEVETPLLIRATPEGARDYIVPSRVNPGKFYALPQSPQIYKQILMIAGVDRYYQFARCLRDEDLRMDRQPEHTQIDLEMSFVSPEDVMEFVEGLYKHIVKITRDIKVEDFPRMSYKEAIDRFGIDKPDLRFSMELKDVSAIVKTSDFSVFKQVIEQGGIVKGLAAPEMSRKDVDGFIDFCTKQGAKGMAWMKVGEKGKLEGSISKFFNESIQKQLIDTFEGTIGKVLMFIADKPDMVNKVLAHLRLALGDKFALRKPDDFKFCWVTDFPLFDWNEEAQKWDPCHHIFSMPKQECIQYLDSDPGKVIADLYDLVLNGTELGSGSIRISDPVIQKKCFDVIGLKEQDAMKKFGFLLEAYRYGAPPHGGIGLGFDRLVALLAGTSDIREVIAFPKNKAAQNPMDGSPSDIDPQQLREAHIKLDIVKKK